MVQATPDSRSFLQQLELPAQIADLLQKAPSVALANKVEELEKLACGPSKTATHTVSYTLPDGTVVDEVDVMRVSNGISANYRDEYMRRRDPNCMVVADDRPSDKERFSDRFDFSFDALKADTMEWLASQDLAIFAFQMGRPNMGGLALAICPVNAGFFAYGLGLLQGVVDLNEVQGNFKPNMIIYVAPPFRHTHFAGKQIVAHQRGEVHEIFSYNLYPGPSAKKGVYGALIELGEQEGWVTTHCSSVQAVTPYDNVVSFMHEGASGGGKSEMLQQPHRLADGSLLLGENVVSGERRYIEIPRTCDLFPVCDDMGLCHPDLQENDNKLYLTDAEDSWFVRVDHIQKYGTDPDLESLTVHPKQPLLFLNIDTVPGGTALIWNHIEDAPGKVCPNPRVIVPRNLVPNTLDKKIPIDIRSFGIRTPPCTRDLPDYGILGLFHVLPPALAWLWRLVSPRGYANPSIVDTGAMSSEGVGSYWPFSTGKRVAQANLLLKQFQDASATNYILIPNQHIGAWKTGFMPQWLVREYLARRANAPFPEGQLIPARCSLLGYALNSVRIEGLTIPKWFLQPETQPEIGEETYDKGAQKMQDFFNAQLEKYLKTDLDPLGKQIIDACLNGADVSTYESLLVTSKC